MSTVTGSIFVWVDPFFACLSSITCNAGRYLSDPATFCGVIACGQCVCLANSCDCARSHARLDLMAFSIVACADLCGKTREDPEVVLERGELEVRIYPNRLHVGKLNLPMCLPSFGSHLQFQQKMPHRQAWNHVHNQCAVQVADCPEELVW
jgi:hypothetical protein